MPQRVRSPSRRETLHALAAPFLTTSADPVGSPDTARPIRMAASYYGIRNNGSDISAVLERLFGELQPGSTIVFEPGNYGIAQPVVVRPRIGEYTGFTLTGGRGAQFNPLARMEAMFILAGDEMCICDLTFGNSNDRASAAFKINGNGINNLRILFVNNRFAHFDWAIDAAATDRVDTINNDCIGSASGFLRFSSNGINSTHFGNYILGGSHGYLLTHHDTGPENERQQAEGVRIQSNTILCTAANAQAIAILGGLEVHIENNVIDQTGEGGIGISLDGDSTHPIWGVKIGTNWIAGGANGAGIRSRGAVANLPIGAVTLTSSVRDNRTTGLDLNGVRGLRVDGAVTLGLTGLAARFANCIEGEIRSTDFRSGTGVEENPECSLLWFGNRAPPPPQSRSRNSRFLENF